MKNVILYGGDTQLVSVRAKTLELQGFSVETVLGFEDFVTACGRTSPALIVLCSSITYDHRMLANQWATEHLPRTPLITLMRSSGRAPNFNGEIVSVADGPIALIEAAKRLTATVQ